MKQKERVTKHLKINSEKCTECKNCIYVCPSTAIEYNSGKIVIANPGYCIKCMHCACICQAEAISFEGTGAYASDKEAQVNAVTKDSLKSFIKSCRSIRNYKDEIVSKAEIEEVINMLPWAASAKNEHHLKAVVVSGRSNADRIFDMVAEYAQREKLFPEIIRQKDRGNNIVMGDAINLMFICGDTRANNPMADAVIAASNARMMFETMGIGSCFSGYLMSIADNIPQLIEFLKIPEGNKIYAVLMFGYKGRETYNKVPYRPEMETIWIGRE